MAWNPAQYGTFIDQRTRPAIELAARIQLDRPDSIIDLGCGPGNSARALRARWPFATITGVDNSPQMLARAAEEGPEAIWIEADISTWRPDAPADLIFSNAALHWIDDHTHLVPQVVAGLSDTGALALQMPRNFDAPSHEIIRKIARSGPWAGTTSGLVREDPVGAPEFYYDVLTPLCSHVDIWETEYLQILEGDDPVLEWIQGTALVPFLSVLDEQTQAAFKSELSRELRVAYPKRKSNKTLFPFKRIFIVAYR